MNNQNSTPSIFLDKINFFKKIAAFFARKIRDFRKWMRAILPYIITVTLLLTLLFGFFFPSIIITINSGEAGVLYKRLFGGTVIDSLYSEGLHAIFPWDTLYIYNMRIQTVMHDFDILTNKGLPIHISFAVRFRPEEEMLGVLHQQVGPDYVNTIIIPQIESVLRTRLSLYDPEDIYTNKNNILTKVVLEALEELGKKYVTTDGIIIRSIELPDAIREAIEDKLVEQQRAKTYVFRLEREEYEAERKRIKAQGISDYHKTITKILSADQLLKWEGIQATLKLAESTNSKVVVIGSNKEGMPLILGNDYSSNSVVAPPLEKDKTTANQTTEVTSDIASNPELVKENVE